MSPAALPTSSPAWYIITLIPALKYQECLHIATVFAHPSARVFLSPPHLSRPWLLLKACLRYHLLHEARSIWSKLSSPLLRSCGPFEPPSRVLGTQPGGQLAEHAPAFLLHNLQLPASVFHVSVNLHITQTSVVAWLLNLNNCWWNLQLNMLIKINTNVRPNLTPFKVKRHHRITFNRRKISKLKLELD